MDVFQLGDTVVDGYGKYIRSFLRIADQEIHDYVAAELDKGRLWPDPLVQLNPALKPAQTIDELVQRDLLHPRASASFAGRRRTAASPARRSDSTATSRTPSRWTKTGRSYVLTTGTGSGKSLAYFVPIVDQVLRTGSRRGIKALVVYPMNGSYRSRMRRHSAILDHGTRVGGKRAA